MRPRILADLESTESQNLESTVLDRMAWEEKPHPDMNDINVFS